MTVDGGAKGLAPARVVLDNGLTVVVKANHTTPSVSILAGVRAGAYADLPGKEGTAALNARVLPAALATVRLGPAPPFRKKRPG